MATYTCDAVSSDFLRVYAPAGKDLMLEVNQAGQRTRVRLGTKKLRLIRDQINAHLGESTALRVGTIMCGTGLTEAQKIKLGRSTIEHCVELSATLMAAFNWSDTAEGDMFWKTIARRLDNMAKSVEIEMSKPDKVGAVHVTSHTTVGVEVKGAGYGTSMTAAEARELAAVLTKHADRVESKS